MQPRANCQLQDLLFIQGLEGNSRIRGEQQFGIRFSVTENISSFHAYARKNNMWILDRQRDTGMHADIADAG